jgi:hypothetical protein
MGTLVFRHACKFKKPNDWLLDIRGRRCWRRSGRQSLHWEPAAVLSVQVWTVRDLAQDSGSLPDRSDVPCLEAGRSARAQGGT